MKKNTSFHISARTVLATLLSLASLALFLSVASVGARTDNTKTPSSIVRRTAPAPQVGPSIFPGPNPASGSISPAGTPATWVGTTISPGGNSNTESTCMENSAAFGCETFTLTVNGNQAAWAGKKIQILLSWTSASNEYDLYIHQGSNAGPLVTSAIQGPGLINQVAYIDSSSIDPSNPTTTFTVHVVYDTTPASEADPYHGSASAVGTTTLSLVPAPLDAGPKVGYENFEAPGVLTSGTALSSGVVTVEYLGRGAGEPSVGVNWVTGVVNFQSDLETEFVTFDDSCNLANPKATWANRRAPTSVFIDSDPIGFTDHTDNTKNRVFAGELTLLSPDTVKISHSDDDGVTWVPDQSGGLGSAVDHETIGGGPYANPLPSPVPSPSPAGIPGVTYPHAIYYCSQDIAAALCARSDDGGSTYGPSIPMYDLTACSGLHGHVKVAPDGTVYVPNRQCGNLPILNGGTSAVVVSTDNGITWAVRPIQNGSDTATGASDDPSVAVDGGGKVYCLFAQNGTNAAVGISSDQGQTWKNIFDIGAGLGLTNVAFPAAIGGDSGRAAVAFYASKGGSGDSSANTYTGVWHLYVAQTFDGGDHWSTTDVTPSMPMQRMGLLRGGGGPMDRNLLDFFDMTTDKDGRVVIGYVNGCAGGDCSQAPVNPDGSTTVTGNTYSATATIARQSSGRRMFAANDPANPTSVPGMPFVTEKRVGSVVHLGWNEADPGNNGGTPPNQTITNYQIRRGTFTGGENPVPIATVSGNVNRLDDTTATDPNVTYYYTVTATNSIGSSCQNNEIAAPYVGDTCSAMIIHRNLPSHPEATGNGATGVPVGPAPTPTPTPPPLTPQLLIDYIAVSEPPSKPGKLLFQMKVSNLSTVPASSRWRMVWNSATTADEQYFVGMTTDAASTVTYEYGTILTQSIPPVVGVIGVPTEEPIGIPDAASGFNADGTISIYIDKALVGNPQPGDFLAAINGRTFNTGDTPGGPGNTFERSTLMVDHTFIKGNTDNSFPAATYTVVGNTACASGAVVPVSAVSRKVHGTAGTFDVDLPLLGNPGIECRTGGQTSDYQVVVTFPSAVTAVTSANVTAPAQVVGSPTRNNTQVTINLTNVPNAQVISINLVGVTVGGNTGNVSIPMALLIGDVNGDAKVLNGDVTLVKNQVSSPVTLSNFRTDVNADGLLLNGDVTITKNHVSTALP